MDQDQRYNHNSDLNDLRYLNDCWLLKQLLQLEHEVLSEYCFEHHSTSR